MTRYTSAGREEIPALPPLQLAAPELQEGEDAEVEVQVFGACGPCVVCLAGQSAFVLRDGE